MTKKRIETINLVDVIAIITFFVSMLFAGMGILPSSAIFAEGFDQATRNSVFKTEIISLVLGIISGFYILFKREWWKPLQRRLEHDRRM